MYNHKARCALQVLSRQNEQLQQTMKSHDAETLREKLNISSTSSHDSSFNEVCLLITLLYANFKHNNFFFKFLRFSPGSCVICQRPPTSVSFAQPHLSLLQAPASPPSSTCYRLPIFRAPSPCLTLSRTCCDRFTPRVTSTWRWALQQPWWRRLALEKIVCKSATPFTCSSGAQRWLRTRARSIT